MTQSAPPPGPEAESFGPFQIGELLGEGGMGLVYEASQRDPIRRTVALKVIKTGKDTPHVLRRFSAERQALARLSHPNIATIFEAGESSRRRPFFAMELVVGVPVTHYCDHSRLSLRQRVEIVLQACDALQHAHERGILHRDLKPSNLLVSETTGQPQLKVIDFGMAKALHGELAEGQKLTAEGILLGTLDYMSPEQAAARPVGERTDVFSLGVVLYELIVGVLPIAHAPGDDAYTVLRRLDEQDIPRPTRRLATLGGEQRGILEQRGATRRQLTAILRDGLEAVVMKALEKNPSRRYASCVEFGDDLRRFLAGDPVTARPPSRFAPLRKWVRRRKSAAVLAALLMAVLAAWGVIAWSTNAVFAKVVDVDLANQKLAFEVGRSQQVYACLEVERDGETLLCPVRLGVAERPFVPADQGVLVSAGEVVRVQIPEFAKDCVPRRLRILGANEPQKRNRIAVVLRRMGAMMDGLGGDPLPLGQAVGLWEEAARSAEGVGGPVLGGGVVFGGKPWRSGEWRGVVVELRK